MRSYKTEPQIWGGREDCDHEWGIETKTEVGRNDGGRDIGGRKGNYPGDGPHKTGTSQGSFCSICNAWRGELGLEPTPELYIQHIVEIFHELRRVLRDDGTCFLNMGDSYANDTKWGGRSGNKNYTSAAGGYKGQREKRNTGLKPKDLCGIPWRVAMALQADGWWLRSDIIWNKPNPMPESVTDRPTRSHEYIFLLTKKARYYYDAEAVREKDSGQTGSAMNFARETKDHVIPSQSKKQHRLDRKATESSGSRNLRTVWSFSTQPYKDAHFATFPEELVRRCILAGTAEQACPTCGAAWERVIDKPFVGDNTTKREDGYVRPEGKDGLCRPPAGATYKGKTLGFRPTCKCGNNDGSGRCIALDPFGGSGTVALVALKHGRDHLTIELKPEYIKMIEKRLKPLGNKPCPQQVEII